MPKSKKSNKKTTKEISNREIEALLKELKNRGVYSSDGSNTEEQVKKWLKNRYSGYPDLARKLLNLLKDKEDLSKGVPLDNISGKYGYSVEHSLDEVEKAYIKAWREKNDL